MRREGKHGIVSNNKIRNNRNCGYVSRNHITVNDIKIRFDKLHYCERCNGRYSCVAIDNDTENIGNRNSISFNRGYYSSHWGNNVI